MFGRRRPGSALDSAMVAGVLALLVGCGVVAPTPPADAKVADATIDGREVGRVTDCAGLGLTQARCNRVLAYTRTLLDSAHPGHGAITREELRDNVTVRLVGGQWQLIVTTETFVAMVEFDLAGGERRVEGVWCGVWQPGDRICDPAVR